MKIRPLISKIEFFNSLDAAKKDFHQKVRKGDLVSVIYIDLEKDQVRLLEFIGYCTKFKSRGYNTKLSLRNTWKKVELEQQFFLYSYSVVDITVLKTNK